MAIKYCIRLITIREVDTNLNGWNGGEELIESKFLNYYYSIKGKNENGKD